VSAIMRILLVFVSVIAFVYMIRKIRKSQLQALDILFWALFSITILLMSIFPDIVIKCTGYLQVQSPVNFVYLVIIFFLILRVFLLNVRICRLELQLNEYIEKTSVNDKIRKENP